LHAGAEGASTDKICRAVLGIDPAEEAARAATMLQSHLNRALAERQGACEHDRGRGDR